MKRKVLVTGASGYIAGLLLPALRQRYDLTLLDVRTTDRQGNEVEGVQIADLTDPNRDNYRHHFSRRGCRRSLRIYSRQKMKTVPSNVFGQSLPT